MAIIGMAVKSTQTKHTQTPSAQQAERRSANAPRMKTAEMTAVVSLALFARVDTIITT